MISKEIIVFTASKRDIKPRSADKQTAPKRRTSSRFCRFLSGAMSLMSGPTIHTIFALPNMRPFMDCPRLLLSIGDNRMAESAGYSSLFPKGLPEVEKDGLNSGQMER